VITLARSATTAVDLGWNGGGGRRVSAVEVIFIVIKFKSRVVVVAFVGFFVDGYHGYHRWVIVKM
jgi:hypothetical protein